MNHTKTVLVAIVSIMGILCIGCSGTIGREADAISVSVPDEPATSSVSVIHKAQETIITNTTMVTTTTVTTTTKPTTTVLSTVTLVEKVETTTSTVETTTVQTEVTASVFHEETSETCSETDPEPISLEGSYESDDTYVYFPNKENPNFTLTWKDYYLLCNCVAHEYGANFVPEYDKALVAEVIMNRVWNAYGGLSADNPDAIYSVITARGQFQGSWKYANLNGFSNQVTQSTQDAVCIFLCHYGNGDVFNEGYTGFYGDGTWNHFR